MFKHILVPLDGSPLAERALPPAIELASALSARLTLLRVVSYFGILVADPQLFEEMRRLSQDEAYAYLRSVAAAVPDHLVVESAFEQGAAADSIVQFAADHAVDLIVMSSHGRSGISRWVYGSVAEKVQSQAPCAITIIRATAGVEQFQCENLLVPLDGSPLAERALIPAVELAQANDAKLHLLQVTSPAHVPLETIAMRHVFDQIEADESNQAGAYLHAKQVELSNVDVVVEVRQGHGSAAESIIDYVRSCQIDLVVMSSHGRSGVSRWVHGSVAEKVMRGSCCATMIVRN